MSGDGLKFTPIDPGSQVRVQGLPGDAPTFYVDGVRGIMSSGQVTKISFFEQVMDPDQPDVIFGRYRVSIAVPNDQFTKIVTLLKQVADDLIADTRAREDKAP